MQRRAFLAVGGASLLAVALSATTATAGEFVVTFHPKGKKKDKQTVVIDAPNEETAIKKFREKNKDCVILHVEHTKGNKGKKK